MKKNYLQNTEAIYQSIAVYAPLFCFVLAFLLAQDVQAQRFSAGPIIGLNASQIDGDREAGYNKLGITAGLRATAWLTDKSDLSIDLLYSQRGSRSATQVSNTLFPFKIKTDYVEVPVMISYKDWLVEDGEESYYKITVQGGLAYGRLFQTTIEDEDQSSSLVQLQDFFRKNDFSFVIGAIFNITEHFGVAARWTRSFTPLYKSGDSNINAPSFVGKFLTFQTLYLF